MEASKSSAREEHATNSTQASSTSLLQASLHAATRVVHANLNKTITARLPLCLPPHAQDPTAYYLGMLVFGQIFEKFETEIDCVLGKILGQSDEPSKEETSLRYAEVIKTQHIPGLFRTNSLRNDLEELRHRLEKLNNAHESQLLSEIEEMVEAAAEEHTRAIGEHISLKPYLALAYTWTMYLALFNGGRWLHRQLASAGPEFWLEEYHVSANSDKTDSGKNRKADDVVALSFWRFDAATQNDPNADLLKLTFKQHFDEASLMLTKTELDEVVDEAKFIFKLCLQLIEVLDDATIKMHQAQSSQDNDNHQQTHDSLAYTNMGISSSVVQMWQSLSSVMSGPAYQLLGWSRILASPFKTEVKSEE